MSEFELMQQFATQRIQLLLRVCQQAIQNQASKVEEAERSRLNFQDEIAKIKMGLDKMTNEHSQLLMSASSNNNLGNTPSKNYSRLKESMQSTPLFKREPGVPVQISSEKLLRRNNGDSLVKRMRAQIEENSKKTLGVTTTPASKRFRDN
jgi:hypothetical protein